MGITNPGTRAQLIDEHVKSMREYAAQLEGGCWPWQFKLRGVIQRIRLCAGQIELRHKLITARERNLDK